MCMHAYAYRAMGVLFYTCMCTHVHAWYAYRAMGVLFYEMMNGHSPFEAEDHLATYQKILDGTVNYPAKMDHDASDLISKLLQKDITRRYGNLKDGAKDIKDHAFYSKAS